MRDTTTSKSEHYSHSLVWRNGDYLGIKNVSINIERESRKVRNKKIKKILEGTI